MEHFLPSKNSHAEPTRQWIPAPSPTSYPPATTYNALQHGEFHGQHRTEARQEALDNTAGPSKIQGRSNGKGKGKEPGKSKVKPMKKVHQCTFEGCDKTFITPAHVRRHLRTHTGLQPYQCEFCEKRFARSDVRNRHMQLSHRELYDAWLSTQSSDRRRQGSKSAGQERDSAEGAEDDGDDDIGEGGAESEECGASDARHRSANTFEFADSAYLMDVDPVQDPLHDVATTTDIHGVSNRHAALHSTHFQYDQVDPELSRRNSRPQDHPYTHTNQSGNYHVHDHDDFRQQSASNTRPPPAMSNTGLPLNLPQDDEHLAGPSNTHRQKQHLEPIERNGRAPVSQLYRHAISAQQHPQHRPDSRNEVLLSSANGPQIDNSYRVVSETQGTMVGARDNEEMLSRLDILLAAAAQPEQRSANKHEAGVEHTGRAQAWNAEVPNNAGGVVLGAMNDSSLTSGLHHQNNGIHAGVSIDANDTRLRGNMDHATGVPILSFPQNNPNSAITPEAFIASTMSLNPGTVPSVISGASPFDLSDIDLDMGLYHDVFGWGLGAADWQQLAVTGQGAGDAGAWTYDMLDLSILNIPTEVVAKASNSLETTAGTFADGTNNEFEGQSSMAGPRAQKTLSAEPGKREGADTVPSMRASGLTTRQGTVTPGNEEETPWPHVFRPPASMFDRLLALPHAMEISDDEAASFLSPTNSHRHQVTPASRASILLLLKVCHSESPWREPDYTHFPSLRVLSHCVGLYFNHFHPILPIMRTSAYRDEPAAHNASSARTGQQEAASRTTTRLNRDEAYYTLQTLTIAAIGATYAEDRLKPLGGYLMELARRIGSYLQLGDPRCIFSIPFIQSRLLIAVGGFADGSRERYLMSEISKGLLITAARRLHLLRERPPRQGVSRQRTKEHSADWPTTAKEVKRMWREWLEEEERVRLGWAIFIFDAQAAAFLNVPAAFALNEIQIRLPDAEELWDISNASMWEESYRTRKSTKEKPQSAHFGIILSTMLKEGRLQERVSDFGRWILAHGLYR
ncbi:hypothetical protein QFC22_006526 [Naganishia vaughanmartiniae]|uniref:Uncharacterized protein n=1 Tax=Naganishia vaughanmartiniae TaxID=1424756 RepID=A0ACC2WJW0_9TREE|nr:hypothetical protein QFC22_006526 [Naganishia vaughanmartiniae]